MIYCFDIDGTIADTDGMDYAGARPRRQWVDHIRDLYAAGHRIVIATARGAGTGTDWWSLTVRQLEEWGVPYDELRCEKPLADIYIDDRGVNAAAYALAMEWQAST